MVEMHADRRSLVREHCSKYYFLEEKKTVAKAVHATRPREKHSQ